MHFILKKTLAQILSTKNHYVVKVKRNQPNLLREIERICKRKKQKSSFKTKEKNRGRKETRITKTYSINQFINANWKGTKTIVYQKRIRNYKNQETTTISYYISSLKLSAQSFSKGIRNHWGIENRLHYVKDVVFKEDHSKIKGGRAPAILSIVKSLVINIIRLNNENQITKFIRKNTGDIKYHMKLLE